MLQAERLGQEEPRTLGASGRRDRDLPCSSRCSRCSSPITAGGGCRDSLDPGGINQGISLLVAETGGSGLRWRAVAVERVSEPPPRRHTELDEHLAQMPLDRAGAYEELGADLTIRLSLHRQASDQVLLGCEVIPCVVAPLADGLSGRPEFLKRTFGKGKHPDIAEHVVGAAQLVPRIGTTILAA